MRRRLPPDPAHVHLKLELYCRQFERLIRPRRRGRVARQAVPVGGARLSANPDRPPHFPTRCWLGSVGRHVSDSVREHGRHGYCLPALRPPFPGAYLSAPEGARTCGLRSCGHFRGGPDAHGRLPGPGQVARPRPITACLVSCGPCYSCSPERRQVQAADSLGGRCLECSQRVASTLRSWAGSAAAPARERSSSASCRTGRTYYVLEAWRLSPDSEGRRRNTAVAAAAGRLALLGRENPPRSPLRSCT